MTDRGFPEWFRSLILLAGSALLLGVIQVSGGVEWAAWVAVVPMMMASSPKIRLRTLTLLSWGVGVIYWLGTVYWVGYVAMGGYIGMSLYLAVYWVIPTVCFRWWRKRGWWLTLGAGLIVAGAEVWQATVFGGFAWRFLGHSQWSSLLLIQFADLTGAIGVSFLVATVNGAAADIYLAWRNGRLLRGENAVRIGIAGSLVMAAIVYGQFRMEQVERRGVFHRNIEKGPLIGVTQPNIPSAVKEVADNGPRILGDMLRLSEEAFKQRADITIWPETIVLAAMNNEYLSFCSPESYPRLYDEIIREHAGEFGYVLFGAHSAFVEVQDESVDLIRQHNSAFLYTPRGVQSDTRYHKIHLVPYGEYVPFHDGWGPVSKMTRAISPYDYDYHLTPGQDYTVFDISVRGRDYRFGVLICYEDTIPRIGRKMVYNNQEGKRVDWLCNLSNDGWYNKYEEGKLIPSGELSERMAITVFRAIENRIGIVRSVNTGVSCMIDSTGRVRDGYIQGDLPERALDRQAVEGWLVDRVMIDQRISPYSRYGNWFDLFSGFALALIFLLTILDAFRTVRRKRAYGKSQTDESGMEVQK